MTIPTPLNKEEFKEVLKRHVYSSELPRLKAIIDNVKKHQCFVFDGEIYFGDINLLSRLYIIKNPSKSFRTWLIDKGLRLSNTD